MVRRKTKGMGRPVTTTGPLGNLIERVGALRAAQLLKVCRARMYRIHNGEAPRPADWPDRIRKALERTK